MLMKVSSFLYPLALHLAAWKIPLSASIRALLCPEIQRAQMASRCFSIVRRALRTGLRRSMAAVSDWATLRKAVNRHLAPLTVGAWRTQRSISLIRHALEVCRSMLISSASASICFSVNGPSALFNVAQRVALGSFASLLPPGGPHPGLW